MTRAVPDTEEHQPIIVAGALWEAANLVAWQQTGVQSTALLRLSPSRKWEDAAFFPVHHSRTNQGRDGVELSPQHSWYFHHKDVAHHAAPDSCQHAEQYRCNWSGVKCQGLPRTRYRKERQSGGIEHQHRAAQAIDHSVQVPVLSLDSEGHNFADDADTKARYLRKILEKVSEISHPVTRGNRKKEDSASKTAEILSGPQE